MKDFSRFTKVSMPHSPDWWLGTYASGSPMNNSKPLYFKCTTSRGSELFEMDIMYYKTKALKVS